MSMRGFTLFFAVLVGSLSLAIGLAIYDLTIREINLSATVTQSEYAIYASDTGAECALYWDAHCVGASCSAGSAFATSTTFQGAAPNSTLYCNNIDITNPAAPTTGAGWAVSNLTSNTGTTNFTISIPNASSSPTQTYCAQVSVAKVGNPPVTTVISNGYNTCSTNTTTGGLQIQRTLQITY